jgi:hypothetical protein
VGRAASQLRARRLTAEIRDRGHEWNRKKATRLMTVAEIEGVYRRRQGKQRCRISTEVLAGYLPRPAGHRPAATVK